MMMMMIPWASLGL